MCERRRIRLLWQFVAIAMGAAALLILVSQWRRLDGVVREAEVVNVDGVERTYRLFVPRVLDEAPLPVVVAFHGTGDSPAAMAEYADLDRMADQHGMLLVMPAAVGGMWTVIGDRAASCEENRDVRFFDELLGHLTSDFNVDAQRVYVIGMSNGGTFAQLLAECRASSIAAVVAHSGPRAPSTAQSAQTYSVMLVVGSDDMPATVDATRSASRQYGELGYTVELIVAEGIGHQWSTRHNSRIWQFLKSHPGSRPRK